MQEIDDPDLDFDFELDLQDPEEGLATTALSTLIAGQAELTLPWPKGKSMRLGQGAILSGKTLGQTPTQDSPFAETDSKLKQFVFREQSSSSYREETTSGSMSSMTHISGSVEVNINLVLVAGSARGDYNKLVRANTDSEKASIHSTFRTGIITFNDLPYLSSDARRLIPPRFGKKARHEAFVKAFGDYYIAGLVLGADNSLMLSASESSKSEEEQLKVKVTVRVLFWKKTFTHESSSQSSELRSEVNVAGFDSLDGEVIDIRPQPRPLPPGMDVKALARFLGGGPWLASIIEQILTRPNTNFHVDWPKIYRDITKARTLESRVREKMAKFGLVDGAMVSEETCMALIEAGLVAEILLVPVSKHPEYIEARSRIY